MTKYEIDRIQNAIRHIQTAVDVDPWAVQIAVEAMRKQIPQKTQKNLQPTCNQLATDCISRQAAIDAILAVTGNSSVRELYEHVQEHGLSDMWSGGVNAAIDIIIAVPSAQPTLYGYNVEHLILIASVLQKENLPPERITEVLTDIGRIVAIVRDEFADNLRKAVENVGFDKQTVGD